MRSELLFDLGDEMEGCSDILFSMYAIPKIFLEGFPGKEMSLRDSVRHYRSIVKLDAMVLEEEGPRKALLEFRRSRAQHTVKIAYGHRSEPWKTHWVKSVSRTRWYYDKHHSQVLSRAARFLMWGDYDLKQTNATCIKVSRRSGFKVIERAFGNVREGLSWLLSRASYRAFEDLYVIEEATDALVSSSSAGGQRALTEKRRAGNRGIVALTTTPNGKVKFADEWSELDIVI